MLIFGHRFIPSVSFYHVEDMDSITNTPPNSTIHIDFKEENLDIISHTNLNQISTSLFVTSIQELIYASALNASFIVVPKELASLAKKIANEYLFDAKILVLIKEENEIEEFALLGVDGVIFLNAIVKINAQNQIA